MSNITVTELQGHTSGGDANKVKIKTGHELEVVGGSGGQLSVNTSSGNERLNVHGAIRASSASADFNAGLEGNIFDFTGTVARIGHVNGASGSAKPIEFLTAGGTKMTLTSDGYLLKPNHPMCSAGAGTTTTSATQEVTNMGVIVNNGNHYNSSNGRFTCPVAGTYEVNVHMISNYAAAYNWIAIFKNGSPVQKMHWNPDTSTGHHYTGLSCLLTCAVNDTLSGGIQNVNGAATAIVANFFLTVKLIG